MALAKDPTSHDQLHISSSMNTIHTNSSFYDTFLGPDLSCHDLIYRFDHDDHPHQSLVNFKAIDGHGSSSSFLSFDQESYSKSSGHEKEEYTSLWGGSNLDVNYFGSNNGRLLENINCYQTSTDMNEHEADHEIFGLFFNEGNDHTIVGTNTLVHGAQVATSFNKRHADDTYLQGESNQGVKKHCTGAIMTKNKPKPKVVISKDPQSIAAKNRRERISERLKVLQELVPNGTKVDLVTMLEKAISYVKFLQVQVKVLATDEFWPVQGGKAPEISEVKEAIDAILSSQRNRK